MASDIQNLRLGLVLTLTTIAGGASLHAQQIRVVDNKGTIATVNNNSVTEAAVAPTNPLEGDVWFDTTTNEVKVWDTDPGPIGVWRVVNTSALNNGQILIGNATNTATGQTMSGDVTITNTGVATVEGLAGIAIPTTAPTNGDILKFDGTSWVFDVDANTTYTAGDGLTLTANDFEVNVDDATIEINTDVLRVKDKGITTAKLADANNAGEILKFDGTSWVFALDEDTINEQAITLNTTDNRINLLNDDNSVNSFIRLDGSTLEAANDGTNDIIRIADGGVTTTQIASGGNDKFLSTSATGVVQWEDKSNLTSVLTQTVTTGNVIASHTSAGTTTNIIETVTNITDAGDGNITFTNEAGTTQTVAKADLTDNADGTYTFTNNDGTDVTIDTNGVVISNVIAGNRIATVTEADGTAVDIDETITTTAQSTGNAAADVTAGDANTIATHTSEDGTAITINETVTNITDAGDGNITFTNEAGTTQTVAKADLTDNADGTYTFTNNDGTDVTIDTNGVVISNVIAGNRIATVTEADGTAVDIDETITTTAQSTGNAAADVTAGDANTIATHTSEDGTAVTINETVTNITDAGDGNITFTNEAGTTQTVAKADLTDNADGTYTFTNNDGTDVTIDTNGVVISNVIAGNRIATVTEADGTAVDIDETITTTAQSTGNAAADVTAGDANTIATHTSEDGTAVTINETVTNITDAGDGNITFTNEAGTTQTVAKADLTDNADGTYTFTNNDGTDVTIDTNGVVISNVIAGNRIATVTEADGTAVDIDETITTTAQSTGNAAADVTAGDANTIATHTSEDGTAVTINETVTNITDAGDGNITFTNEAGTTQTVAKADLTDNADGTYTFTNNDGTDVTIDTNGVVISNVIAGNRIATVTEADGTAVDIDETITTTAQSTGNAAADVTAGDANTIATHTSEDGTAVTINETVTNITDAGDGNITFTNEAGTTQTVAKADLTDNADGTYTFTNNDGTDVTIDTNGVVISNVIAGNRIATVTEADGTAVDIDETITTTAQSTGNAAADVTAGDANTIATHTSEDGTAVTINETVTNITDAGDGNITFTNEAGTTQTVAKADLTDNADGTYTFTNNDGTDVTIDTNGVVISNVIAGNRIATVTEADGTAVDIDETITTTAQSTGNAAADVTAGDANTIATHTSEDGTAVTINETVTNITDAGDGNITFTNEAGTTQTVAKADLTDNADGTYTFTNNDGTDVTIDTNGVVISNVIAGNRIATVTEADGTAVDIDETITTTAQSTGNAAADVTAGDANTIATHTSEDGTAVTINETVTNITDAGDGNITFTNEAGTTQTVAKADLTDNADGTYTFTNNDGTDVTIDTNGVVISNVIAGNRIATVTEADGTAVDIDETITTTAQSTGNAAADVTAGDANTIATHTSEDGTAVTINETVTNITDAGDGNITFTNEAGTTQTVAKADLTDNADGTYTFTNNDGTDVTIDTNGVVISNVIAGNRIATVTEADGTAVDIDETITTTAQSTGNAAADVTAGDANTIATHTSEDGTAVTINETVTNITDAGDGNITFTNEAGTTQTVAKADLTDNADGTYTFTNNDGTDVTIDTNGVVISNVIAGNRIATVTEADGTAVDIDETITTTAQSTGNAAADVTAGDANTIATHTSENGTAVTINETVTNITDAGDGNITFTNEAGTTQTVAKADLTDNADGTYTFTNNDGTDVTIDTNGVVISNVIAGNRIATVTEADGTAVDIDETITTTAQSTGNAAADVTAGDANTIATHTSEDGTAVTINETVTNITDAGDGNITFTNEAGTTQTVAKADLTDNADGTYTFTNNDGTDVTIDTNGVVISNVIAGNRIATVTEADGTAVDIDETITTTAQSTGNAAADVTAGDANTIATHTSEDGTAVTINETVTNITDAGDGNITFTNEAGTTQTVAKADLTDNADGTYTFTNNDGTDVTIDTNGVVISNVIAGNRIATVTEADGTAVDIDETITTTAQSTGNAAADVTAGDANTIATHTSENGTAVTINETVTNITDAGDGNITFTNEAGTTQTVAKADLTDNADGTYTFTNNDGTDVTIDTNGVVISNVIAGNRIATVTEADGTAVDIDETITTTAQSTGNAAADVTAGDANTIATHTSEDGTAVTINETVTNITDAGDGNITFTNEAGTTQTVAKADLTDNADGTYTFTNNDGTDVTIDTNGVVISNVIAGNRIATVTEADGTAVDIDETITTTAQSTGNAAADVTAGDANTIATHTSEDGTAVTINETVTNITDAGDGNITFTNEAGTTQTVAKADLTDNADGTYTFTNNDGTDVTIDTNGVVISNVIAGNRIATVTEADGTAVDIDETITTTAQSTGNAAADVTAGDANTIATHTSEDGTAVTINETVTNITDAGDGNITFTNEAGTTQTVAKADLTDNADGTYTFTNNDGTDVTIDTNGVVISNVIAGNRIATVTEADGTAVDIDETITTTAQSTGNAAADVTAGDANTIATHTSEDGTAVTINETVTNITDAGDGNITFTNEAGTTQTVAKADLTDNADGTYTFTNNDGTDVTIDTNGVVISNVIAGNRIATVTEADGTAVDIDETITTTAQSTGNAAADVTAGDANTIATHTSEDGTAVTINETVTNITDAGDGNITFTNEAGTTQTVAKADLTDNADGTYTFTNNDGTDVTIDTNGVVISNVIAGNRIATVTEADGTAVDIDETITTTAQSTGNAAADVTAGDANTIATHTSENGTAVTINETVTNITDAGDGNITFTNEAGTTQTVAKADLTDNADGTYTFTNNDGTDVTIDTNGVVISNVIAGNRIATVTEADGTAVDIDETITTTAQSTGNAAADVTAGDANTIATHTSEDGTAVTINETVTNITDAGDGNITFTNEAGTTQTVAKADLTDNADGTYTFTNNDGTDVTIDTNGVVISNVIAGNRIATVTEADGTAVDIDETITTTAQSTGNAAADVTAGDANTIATHTSENGTAVTINETVTNITDAGDGNITFTNEAGTTQTVAKADLTDNADGTYTFTNNDGTDVTIDTNGVVISNVIAGNRIATVTEADGTAVDIDETITTTAQSTGNAAADVTAGDANTIATHTSEDGTAVTINETVTTLASSGTGNLTKTYTNEAGTNVVFVASPVKAFGKVNGNGSAAKIYGATVTRLSTGDYEVTFDTALTSDDYVIQLTLLDCGGNCPPAGGPNYDDPGITYYQQTASSFRVNIGDSDNGTNPKVDIDQQFMFTVMDY